MPDPLSVLDWVMETGLLPSTFAIVIDDNETDQSFPRSLSVSESVSDFSRNFFDCDSDTDRDTELPIDQFVQPHVLIFGKKSGRAVAP